MDCGHSRVAGGNRRAEFPRDRRAAELDSPGRGVTSSRWPDSPGCGRRSWPCKSGRLKRCGCCGRWPWRHSPLLGAVPACRLGSRALELDRRQEPRPGLRHAHQLPAAEIVDAAFAAQAQDRGIVALAVIKPRRRSRRSRPQGHPRHFRASCWKAIFPRARPRASATCWPIPTPSWSNSPRAAA